MHLLIINASPRLQKKSNTEKIIQEFKKGYEQCGHTNQVVHLSKRNQWDEMIQLFQTNTNILFALPLYVECIPGIMVEFLEKLEPKHDDTCIGFLVQGGFAEASQLRCCEKYLEMLPEMLGCHYQGTLIKGDMFAIRFLDEKMRTSLVQPFYQMGQYYGQNHFFSKEEVNKFAKPEYFSKQFIFMNQILSPLKKLFFVFFAKKLGCQSSLTAKPYQKYLIQTKGGKK